MIKCYAPTDIAELQDKENFSQLNAVVDKISKGDIKILNFNAKVGSHEHVMGRHGLGEISENGELFAQFCGNNGMVIGGSLFHHQPVQNVTISSTENGDGAFLVCGTNVAPTLSSNRRDPTAHC